MWKGLEKLVGAPDEDATFSKVQESTYHMQRFDAEQRLELMDEYGIQKSVLSFPSMPVYMGAAGETARPQQRKQSAQFINDHFAEVHRNHPQRLLFFADVPLSVDVDFSCRELHRAIEDLRLQGAAIPTNIAGRRPSEPEFEEFFSEAEKMGVPLFIHPQNAYGREQMRKYMITTIIGYPAETSLTAAYMILDGFMEKHKNLKIILGHLGGFIPYLYRRLNAHTEASGVDPTKSGKANLSNQPSDYLAQFYYDTALGNSEALELCLKVVGCDRILFGTDHPYIEKAEAKSIDFIDRTGLAADVRDKIYRLNADKLFKD
jgi:predicted TIM-barrel fold metal-dependent hydrolase